MINKIMPEEVLIVHCIDTEGPMYESLEATFERINQWKNCLDANEISFVEDICGDLMTKFGYELSGFKNDNSLYEVIHSKEYLNNTLKNYIEKT